MGRSVIKCDSDHSVRILMDPSIAGSNRKQLSCVEFRWQLFKVVRPKLLELATKVLICQLPAAETLENGASCNHHFVSTVIMVDKEGLSQENYQAQSFLRFARCSCFLFSFSFALPLL